LEVVLERFALLELGHDVAGQPDAHLWVVAFGMGSGDDLARGRGELLPGALVEQPTGWAADDDYDAATFALEVAGRKLVEGGGPLLDTLHDLVDRLDVVEQVDQQRILALVDLGVE